VISRCRNTIAHHRVQHGACLLAVPFLERLFPAWIVVAVRYHIDFQLFACLKR
jgi:hypothetical protein